MNKKYPTFFLTWFNKFSRVPYPGTNVTIPGHLSHQAHLACEETPSINLGDKKSDVNLNICNFDRILSHWFSNAEEFPRTCR